jgi:hypothetical protein
MAVIFKGETNSIFTIDAAHEKRTQKKEGIMN